MDKNLLEELDDIYLRYGYEPRKGTPKTKVYLFTQSIYNGADIIKLDNSNEADELKAKYALQGYAVKVREYKSVNEVEETLFKDFFKAEGVIQNLKKRYQHFVKRVMENLPEGAKYEYIRSSYELTEYDNIDNYGTPKTFSAEDESNAVVPKIVNLINNHVGPLLVIIEAAAGYGKTCSAYEILNDFIKLSSIKIPFFTELSRDRKATIFRHILQYEIEEQFANRVDSKVVIHEIKKGRIPLIIDGFDELITKDFSFNSSQFEQVESMLSTIVDLLTDNAKVIITSRKTAIFNSEEFHNWMLDRNINYNLAKVTIAEPSIENWLSKGRLDIITENKFPVEQISNPVLLSFLRHSSVEDLKNMIVENQSIVDKYFGFLLTREQNRQGLLIEPESQLRVFRKLTRFMTSWDIKSESKELIKELILDYNKPLLEETRKKYTPEKRPRIDQLADILSNHAFLDRKERNQIGFVNEFVLGTLVGENLALGKYQEHNKNFQLELSQAFALLAVQSFQVQSQDRKINLWEVFNKNEFPYDPQFYFKIDVEFKKQLVRNYSTATLEGFELKKFKFEKKEQFTSTVFTNCTFYNCGFHFSSFKNCSFVNCRFYDCYLIDQSISFSDEYFTIYGCDDNNGFEKNVFDCIGAEITENVNLEKEILSLFFKKGSFKPRHRQLSQIKNELSDFDGKTISRVIHQIKSLDLISFNGDLCHLTKTGIAYFNENYRSQE